VSHGIVSLQTLPIAYNVTRPQVLAENIRLFRQIGHDLADRNIAKIDTDVSNDRSDFH